MTLCPPPRSARGNLARNSHGCRMRGSQAQRLRFIFTCKAERERDPVIPVTSGGGNSTQDPPGMQGPRHWGRLLLAPRCIPGAHMGCRPLNQQCGQDVGSAGRAHACPQRSSQVLTRRAPPSAPRQAGVSWGRGGARWTWPRFCCAGPPEPCRVHRVPEATHGQRECPSCLALTSVKLYLPVLRPRGKPGKGSWLGPLRPFGY